MAEFFDALTEAHRVFIAKQPVFFVATAPLSGDGHVNVSPKGTRGTFRVLDAHRVAYLDLTGSGVETIAHLRENGRITVMCCAFEGPPRIVRLSGTGHVVTPGDDDFELRYHHFSVVMNGQRRLAFYTACNIDGRNAKKINRKTGDIRPMTPADVCNESLEGAEGSETWYKDARIALDQQTNQALYDAQQVAGFGTRDAGRLGRILQRGHLVRRMDPSWGDDALALKADADWPV